jgi:hypothetical protein
VLRDVTGLGNYDEVLKCAEVIDVNQRPTRVLELDA